MSAKGATELMSNPVGKIMDQAGIKRPTIALGNGQNLDLTAALSPTGYGQIGQIQNFARNYEEKRLTDKAKAAENDKYQADQEAFKKFKEQELNLNAQSDIFIPQYKSSKSSKLAKETQALADIFNARKQELMQRRSTPGISQTRIGYM